MNDKTYLTLLNENVLSGLFRALRNIEEGKLSTAHRILAQLRADLFELITKEWPYVPENRKILVQWFQDVDTEVRSWITRVTVLLDYAVDYAGHGKNNGHNDAVLLLRCYNEELETLQMRTRNTLLAHGLEPNKEAA